MLRGEIVSKLLGSRVMDDDNGLTCDTPFFLLIEGYKLHLLKIHVNRIS